jgi:hypothetical protein
MIKMHHHDLIYLNEVTMERLMLPLFNDRNQYYEAEDMCIEDILPLTDCLQDTVWEFSFDIDES